MYVAYLYPVAFDTSPKVAGSLARGRQWTTISAWSTAGPRSVLLSKVSGCRLSMGSSSNDLAKMEDR